MKKLTAFLSMMLVFVASLAAQTSQSFSLKSLLKQEDSDGYRYWLLKHKDDLAKSLEQDGFVYKETGVEKEFFGCDDCEDESNIDAEWKLYQKGDINVYSYYYVADGGYLDAVEIVFADKEAARNFIETAIKDGLHLNEYNSGYYNLDSLTIYYKNPTTIHIEAIP